jgi:hypothetical protein
LGISPCSGRLGGPSQQMIRAKVRSVLATTRIAEVLPLGARMAGTCPSQQAKCQWTPPPLSASPRSRITPGADARFRIRCRRQVTALVCGTSSGSRWRSWRARCLARNQRRQTPLGVAPCLGTFCPRLALSACHAPQPLVPGKVPAVRRSACIPNPALRLFLPGAFSKFASLPASDGPLQLVSIRFRNNRCGENRWELLTNLGQGAEQPLRAQTPQRYHRPGPCRRHRYGPLQRHSGGAATEKAK